MDSSDGDPLRLFNFGGAHAAAFRRSRVLAMTALADSYNKHAAGRRMQNPGWAKQASVRFPERDSALIKRRYRRSSAVSSFVIRHSSFVIRRGFEVENFAARLTPSTHRPECRDVFPLPKPFRSLDRDSNRSNRPSVSEHNHVIHRHRRRARA